MIAIVEKLEVGMAFIVKTNKEGEFEIGFRFKLFILLNLCCFILYKQYANIIKVNLLVQERMKQLL